MNFAEFDCLVRALHVMTPRQRRAFFELSSTAQMKAFEEACFNLVKNPKLASKKLRALAGKYGATIKVLAKRSTALKRKRSLLMQKGGFLGALLPVLASIVTSMISN